MNILIADVIHTVFVRHKDNLFTRGCDKIKPKQFSEFSSWATGFSVKFLKRLSRLFQSSSFKNGNDISLKLVLHDTILLATCLATLEKEIHFKLQETCYTLQQTITLKMENQGRSDFYVVITMSLCPLGLKQLLISLLFQIIPL